MTAMKRTIILLLACLLSMSLTACTIKEKIDLTYGDNYQITNEKLSTYKSLEWESADTAIAEVSNGYISAKGPGTTLISATVNNKKIAEFTVNVAIVPITGIVLSTTSDDVTEGETLKLEYTLFPESASKFGLNWKSADESIATVNASGIVTGVAPGQTTIVLSSEDGVIATCAITVLQKPAYERLSDEERAFLDLFCKYVSNFKNPSSIIIKGVELAVSSDIYIVEVTAQNGFGGNGTSRYWISDSLGIWDMEDLNVDFDYEADSSYNIDLLNEALHELQ